MIPETGEDLFSCWPETLAAKNPGQAENPAGTVFDPVLPVIEDIAIEMAPEPDHVKEQKGVQAGIEALMNQNELALLLREMKVKDSHILAALQRHEMTGEPLQVIMRDFGFISAERLAQVLARLHRMNYFSATQVDLIDAATMAHLDTHNLTHYVPVGYDTLRQLQVAISDPDEATAARNRYHRENPVLVMASPNTIQAVYRTCFANTEQELDTLVAAYNLAEASQDVENYPHLIQDILGGLVRHACYAGASDLYLNYSDLVGVIRLKINDVGSLFRTVDRRLMDRLLTKLVGEHSNAEALRREPQESTFDFGENQKNQYQDLVHRYMFRMELMETQGKQQAVIRILDRQSAEVEFDNLGFDSQTAATLKRYIHMPCGIIVVTGPTGSGKTTTQYALLQLIDSVERSIQTIENPIEYRHGLWLQHEPPSGEGNEGEGTRKILNALLRSAPDVILFGEVRRDRGVARVMFDAANTGHLVFTTLHVPNGPMAIQAFRDMGIDETHLASLKAIIAQRLPRRLCPACKVDEDRSGMLREFDVPWWDRPQTETKVFRPSGCRRCRYTGYIGRVMISDTLDAQTIRELLQKGVQLGTVIENRARAGHSLFASGLRLAADGVISIDEAIRVAREE